MVRCFVMVVVYVVVSACLLFVGVLGSAVAAARRRADLPAHFPVCVCATAAIRSARKTAFTIRNVFLPVNLSSATERYLKTVANKRSCEVKKAVRLARQAASRQAQALA